MTEDLRVCRSCKSKCRLAGTTPIGNQRYRCMTCGKTQTARKPKKTDAQKSKDYRDRKKTDRFVLNN